MMAPRPVIAGNWKMNLDPDEVRHFFQQFRPSFPDEQAPELLVFPASVSLFAAQVAAPKDPVVQVGIQNIYWERSGAFTGEISASMARAAGATHALIGHSERRHVFGETDEDVARKVEAALTEDLIPVVCVGETLDERKGGRLEEVILRQLNAVLPSFEPRQRAAWMVAYEPVWAIGTGETATPADAAEAHAMLRVRLTEALGEERGGVVPILYGGSVKPGNARDLLQAPHVGGVLVGGASLEPSSFAGIAEAAVTR